MHTPPKGANESVSILRTPKSAMNDTKKIKKTKKRVVTPKAAQHNTSSGFNLTDLRKVYFNMVLIYSGTSLIQTPPFPTDYPDN